MQQEQALWLSLLASYGLLLVLVLVLVLVLALLLPLLLLLICALSAPASRCHASIHLLDAGTRINQIQSSKLAAAAAAGANAGASKYVAETA